MESVIKKVLDVSGMTQKELAEKIFVTPQAVSKWVRGESRPSLDNAQRIYEITGVNIMKQTNDLRCSTKEMNKKALSEIDDYNKAKIEAEEILNRASIKKNYSHSVYKLCSMLLPVVICLTHHQWLDWKANKKNDKIFAEIEYSSIFENLLDFFDDIRNKSIEVVPGLYENQLEYSIFRMGGDLFESFDEYTIPDHTYCQMAMCEWYNFQRALIKDSSSSLYNEFRVALVEIAELEFIDE